MTVVLAWLRLDLQRRWRSLAVLALLIAIAGATVMASFAGARRGASTIERLNARTLPAIAAVLANTPNFDWSKIRALPEVEALTTFVVDYSWSIEGISGDPGAFPPADDATMRTIEKPIVYAGRVFNAQRADEVVVTRQFVSQHHKGVGDTLVIELANQKELEGLGPGPGNTFHGPHVKVHIVGVVSSPWFSDNPGGSGGVVLSPGITKRYSANIIGDPKDPNNYQYVNALIRLHGGEAALPKFRNDLAAVTGRSDIDVLNLADQNRSLQHQLTFEARCLAAFGGAALIAALFLIGQAIVRYTAASTAELQTLRAVGMAPRQVIATAAAGPAIAGVVGAVLSGLFAFVAAHWFPIGTASLLEPTPGVAIDWVVFGPGLALIVALVVIGATSAGWLAIGAARRADRVRRSTIAVAVARGGASVPVVIGVRFALESGRGRTAVPVRPALIGSVIGVLGILAAFTFSHGVSDAATHPERFGQTFQYTTFIGLNSKDFGSSSKVLAALQKQASVTGIDDGRTAVATGPGGHGSVSLYAYSRGPKPMPVIVTGGRLPTAADEVALAPQSLTALKTSIGSKVELTGDKGPRTLLVTGTALVPAGPHNGYADGGWLAPTGYDALFKGFKFHIIFVTLSPSARGPHAGAALAAAVIKQSPDLKGLSFDPPDPLGEVSALLQVRVLPIVLGVFLALLAVGAVGHALATAVRRRSHDLAVLRALGLTQWQCRWVVVTQATVLALIGLVFGIPLGLAVGRSVWRVVADYTPLEYVPPFALWAMLLVGPAALLIANGLAALPGRRAARLPIAHILRTE